MAGPAAGRRLAFEGGIVFGRNPDAENLGDDPELSRTHARIRMRGQMIELEDLGSTNGTRVNGELVAGPTMLSAGDRVALGSSLLELRAAETATEIRPGPPPRRALTPAPTDPPPFAPPPTPSRPARAGVRLPAVVSLMLAAAAVAAAVALLASGSGTGGSGTAASFDGTVYLLSGRSAPGANSVLAYRYRAGSLAPVDLREYPTGGSGAFDQSNRGILDSVGQIADNPSHNELFAVNESSDTVAAFHVASDGTLAPVKGSPFPSGGTAPASVAVRGSVLVVANKSADGVRHDLRSQPGSYTSLPIRSDGSLGSPISTVTVPPRGAATQALVTPDGSLMIGSLESGQFVVLRIAADGALSQAPGSPQLLDSTRFPPASHQGPFWPQGLAVLPAQHLLYANVSNAAQLAVYSYTPSGSLSFLGAVANRGSQLPCWTVVNVAGTRLYTDNAGNDTVSVFDIAADPRHPRQLQTLHLRGQGNPWNNALDPGGRFLFALDPRAVDFINAGQGNTVASLRVNADGTLTELASSPAAIPVSTDTQPQGLLAIARR